MKRLALVLTVLMASCSQRDTHYVAFHGSPFVHHEDCDQTLHYQLEQAVFFSSPEAAFRAGYGACPRCRPYSPNWPMTFLVAVTTPAGFFLSRIEWMEKDRAPGLIWLRFLWSAGRGVVYTFLGLLIVGCPVLLIAGFNGRAGEDWLKAWQLMAGGVIGSSIGAVWHGKQWLEASLHEVGRSDNSKTP